MKSILLKSILLIVFALFCSFLSYGQDIIILKNGRKIDCKIIKEDSLNVYLEVKQKGKDVFTFKDKNEIYLIDYEGKISNRRKAKTDAIVYFSGTYVSGEIISEDSVKVLVKFNNNYDIAIDSSIEKKHITKIWRKNDGNNHLSTMKYEVPEQFIYLFSNSKIKGSYIELKRPFLGSVHLLVDSVKYKAEDVKFYKNHEGFFANISAMSFTNTHFAECINEGKVNLFDYTTTTYRPMTGSNGMYAGGGFSSTTKYFYNKGFGDLKKANYKNLSVDLADNPASMLLLKQYKNTSDAQIALGVIGSVLMVGGLISIMNKTKDYHGTENEKKPNEDTELGVMIAGAACFGVVWILSFSKPDRLSKAIETYNK